MTLAISVLVREYGEIEWPDSDVLPTDQEVFVALNGGVGGYQILRDEVIRVESVGH